jgi:hypothetical protein
MTPASLRTYPNLSESIRAKISPIYQLLTPDGSLTADTPAGEKTPFIVVAATANLCQRLLSTFSTLVNVRVNV